MISLSGVLQTVKCYEKVKEMKKAKQLEKRTHAKINLKEKKVHFLK